jgi:hypothetical protein
MGTESQANDFEQAATDSELIQNDNATAGVDWEKAGDIREDLGDKDANTAEYWENPAPPQVADPELTRSHRCAAARQYLRAASDFAGAARALGAQGKAAAAAKMRDKTKAAAKKGIKWFEGCVDREFEEGQTFRRLWTDYERLAHFYELLEMPDEAKRAQRKADLVKKIHEQAAEEVQPPPKTGEK